MLDKRKISVKTTIMKKNTLFQKMIQQLLIIGLGLILASCGTVPHHQTYLTSSAFSGMSKISIHTSVSNLKVEYTVRTGSGAGIIMPLSPLIALSAVGIESYAKTSKDKETAIEIKNQLNLPEIEEEIAQVFITALSKSNSLQPPQYIYNKDQKERELTDDGYDAAIKLAINELSLKRINGDCVDLYVHIRGELKSLKSGEVIWDREENAVSSAAYPLDYYKDKGNFMRELRTLLHKVIQNLSYDFTYLK